MVTVTVVNLESLDSEPIVLSGIMRSRPSRPWSLQVRQTRSQSEESPKIMFQVTQSVHFLL
jgi:hypothetical protein